jgi:hypothetical protein
MNLPRKEPGEHDHDHTERRERAACAGERDEAALELVDGEDEPERHRERRREAEARARPLGADAGDVDHDRDALHDPPDQQRGAQTRRVTLTRNRRCEIAREGNDARHGERQCHRRDCSRFGTER